MFACRARPAQAQQGFTLLEALVAILILSIGLLGIAGLQAASLRFSQGGWTRAAVTSGVSGLAERIRANPAATANAYQLATVYADQRKEIADGTVQGTVTKGNCLAKTCAAANLASFDLASWRLALDAAMPGAAGFVAGDRVAGYQATIMWFDKGYVDDASPPALVKAADKNCSDSATGIAQRHCCPTDAAAPDGVRCVNFTVIP